MGNGHITGNLSKFLGPGGGYLSMGLALPSRSKSDSRRQI